MRAGTATSSRGSNMRQVSPRCQVSSSSTSASRVYEMGDVEVHRGKAAAGRRASFFVFLWCVRVIDDALALFLKRGG